MGKDILNIKYIIGNCVIAVVVVLWAAALSKLAGDTFETLRMCAVSLIQGTLWACGWRFLIIYPERLEVKKCVCTQPVSAMLIDYKVGGVLGGITSSTISKDYTTRYAEYVFDWNGYEMRVTSDLPYRGSAVKRVPSEILVNPHNPDEIYEPQIERSRIAHYRVTGSMLILWGFLSFFEMIGG